MLREYQNDEVLQMIQRHAYNTLKKIMIKFNSFFIDFLQYP